MTKLFLFLASLVSFASAATPPDHFKVRLKLPRTDVPCEIHLTKNTEALDWRNVPSHWVHFQPIASAQTPAKWETDASKIRVFHEVDDVREQQVAFTMVPEGLRNTYKNTHGKLLQAMFHGDDQILFPEKYLRAQEFYRAQSAQDQHLIQAALQTLKTGEGGDVMAVRVLIQHEDGELQILSAGFDLILPDQTSPRGLIVLPYLHRGIDDEFINLTYRAGTLEGFEEHSAAILPVEIEAY